MIGIIGIIASLTVLLLSLLITRLATMALTLTGMSRETARFQARSAFTATGFTTAESEHVVNHPIRRRIIMWLMVLRSAGIITILLSIILSFVGAEDDIHKLYRLGWLVGGVAVLWVLTASKTVTHVIERLMERFLRRYTDLPVRDYAGLLKLSGEYAVQEAHIEDGDWLAEKTLGECDLLREGISVLGIERDDGSYVGAPRGDTRIHAGDTLILYGQSSVLEELDERKTGRDGDVAHDQAVDNEQRRLEEQDRQELQHDQKRHAQDQAESHAQAEQSHASQAGESSA